jgi:hypothetical protein
VSHADDADSVELIGELDIADADALRRVLARMLHDHHSRLVVDARDLAFIDLAGCRALAGASEAAPGRIAMLGDHGPAFAPFRRAGCVDELLHGLARIPNAPNPYPLVTPNGRASA